ncbi:MAG: lipopolysaccharide transport periplasmic protein LptA [Halioglobus sp.]|nr:lipopolysaccharide transport periplasmic protein LptA [Halioglobus sp.]
MPTYCPPHHASPIRGLARIVVLFLSLSAALVQALPEDRDKPMRITADKAERDDVNGITVYTGNVILIQGTLKLESDKLTIYHEVEADPSKIVAEGKPAKMQQRPKPEKAIMYAEGQVITYYKPEERIHLQTDGYVEQDGRVVNGDSIDYYIEKELTKAKSGKDTRVVVVIPPSELKSKDDSGTTESK